MSKIEEIFTFVNRIPPFPGIARRVIELLEDPDVSAEYLADVIQYDQAITAHVMGMCNSAYFGFPRKIYSISEALVMLGQSALKDLVMAGAAAGYYEGKAGGGYKLEEGELWKHSVAVGLMAKSLGRYVSDVDLGSVFTVGLLHDIGKSFLSAFVSDDFDRIMERVERDDCSFVSAEYEVIGINHAEIGGIIMEKWEFPDSQIEAVRNHHAPFALTDEPLTALTALSNNLVKSIGIGGDAKGFNAEVREDGLKRLGISRVEMQLCMSDLILEMDKARELVNI
ncbi:MAG: HDOD domain-containing protein [Thermodesulfobacteriota bacterium]